MMKKRLSRLRYRFDELKRCRCYKKGSRPCLRTSIFDRDTELLSYARYYSDKWRYLIECCLSSDLSIIETDSSYSYVMFCSDWLC